MLKLIRLNKNPIKNNNKASNTYKFKKRPNKQKASQP